MIPKEKKIYLSYAMTEAAEEDRALRKRVREEIRRQAVQEDVRLYDPEIDEPEGQTLAFLQDYDFNEMRTASGVLVIWGPGTHTSRGVAAEIEWARRVFGIPVVIYSPDWDVNIPAWTRASARGRVYHYFTTAWRTLRELVEMDAELGTRSERRFPSHVDP